MHIDLFCRVVDNYGDIGVCWRLARRLAHDHHAALRLWVDDLATFARIEPGIDTGLAAQTHAGIEVRRWDADAGDVEPGDLVIEAFACDPPDAFVARMRTRQPQPAWINLEYLSAEDWIDSFHGMPSLRSDGTSKAFFFPGFTPATGGLLREPGLIAARDAWRQDREAQAAFLARLGIERPEGAGLVTLFCYPHAPVDALIAGLSRAEGCTVLAVPEGVAPALAAGRQGNVTICRYPLVPQHDFDRLLWSADLNFVRGEDSFVRAHWAGVPLVWQIYPQEEDAHLVKLDAWIARSGMDADIAALQRAWNGGDTETTVADALAQALTPTRWAAWQADTHRFVDALQQQPDLADRLMQWARFA